MRGSEVLQTPDLVSGVKLGDDRALACITLDVEPDFTDYAVTSYSQRHYGLFDAPEQFAQFCNLIEKYGVKLTCFVVGSVFQDRSEHLQELLRIGAEFGCHSLTHDLATQGDEREVLGGIEAFTDYFGYLPQGYRSPFFKMKPAMLEMLERVGVRYDSSFMPSVSPIGFDVYHNLGGFTQPFRWQGLSLIEFPLAVFPYVRLPIALSYIKVLGKSLFCALKAALGLPNPLVTFFHPMNIVYSPEAFGKLSLRWKLANSRNRWNGLEMLEWFLAWLRAAGYRFVHMSELYQRLMIDQLSVAAFQ